jgi:pimeloyl-ACP methyl ester carboxylesterase
MKNRHFRRLRGFPDGISRLLLTGVVAVTLVACGDDDERAPAVSAPRIETTACPFTLPLDQNPDDVTCGNLIVAENRKHPTDRTVSIAFAVFKPTGTDPVADPLIMLPGGPGEIELDFVQYDVPDWFGWAHPDRTLVFFDQRGTGYSLPSLDCPEYRTASQAAQALPLTLEEEDAMLRQGLRACHDRLVGEGIDFGAYNSAEGARDVQDLMATLGYRTWNAYGLSYGTRLALTLMRDAPQGIRSVVRDSTIPIQANHLAETPAICQRPFDLMFEQCAADPSCAAVYPDLEQALYDLVAQLNNAPVTLHGTDPWTGETLTLVLTGDRLLWNLHALQYDRNLLGVIPLLIASAADGDYELPSELIVTPEPTDLIWGVFYIYQCAEEAPFNTPAIVDAATADVREEFKHVFLTRWTNFTLDICAFWGSPRSPAIENQPVASALPTLVLAGEYDPITPPSYGRLAAETLSHSSFFDFPAFGHGTLGAGCPDEIRTAFLNAPASPLDGSCVTSMPQLAFEGPGGAGAAEIRSRPRRATRFVW